MRIWHEQLIPHLCRPHLLGVWREALGCYKIVTEDLDGYSKHPAVREFEASIPALWGRLRDIRVEMLDRGWNPKPVPELVLIEGKQEDPIEWQTLEEQLEVLRGKDCECDLSSFN